MTLGVALALSIPGRSPDAQGTWGLTLFVAPFPSPYQSDWETNPNISSLTIVNPTGVEREVKFVYTVVNVNGGKLLASGQGDPLGIAAGAPTVLTSIVDIPGTSSSDQAMQDQMERTGRLPEGTYRACVSMTDRNNFVLGNSCATFTIVYPDPPYLVAPALGETIPNSSPLFQWTPVQVPAAYQVRYALQIAEMRPNQTAEEALNASIPHYQAPDLEVTNLQYPVEGQPFEVGKQYVWRVVAIDQNGFSPSSGNGSSQIRSFTLGDGGDPGSRRPIKLSLANAFDTDPALASDSPATGETIDIAELCGRWNNPPAGITISADSPFGMRRFAGRPAVLYQNADSNNKRWWISLAKTADARRTVLLGGDCLTFSGKARTRWIASKDSALQAWTSNVMKGLSHSAGGFDSVAFGMVVLALGKDKVEVPADFDEGQAFLGGRTLDVAPGLNAYAVLSLKDWGLWWLMQGLGFDEKEIEVKGFLGWDATWSLGGTVGADQGVDLSTERKFLVLTAALPKRKPVGPLEGLFQEGGISFEVSIGDSLGRGLGTKENKYSLDLVGKLIYTMQVNDELAFEASVGLDLSRESSRPIGKEMLDRWDWLRGKRRSMASYLSDTTGTDSAGRAAKLSQKLGKAIQPGEMDDPEPGLDVVIGLKSKGRISSIWKDSASLVEVDGLSIDAKISLKDPKYSIAIAGSVSINGLQEVVKVGASKEFKYGPKPDLLALQDSVMYADEKWRLLIDGMKPPYPECGLSTRDTEFCKAFLGWYKAKKNLAEAKSPGKSWRVRISAGQMPLGKLLDLIKQAVQP